MYSLLNHIHMNGLYSIARHACTIIYTIYLYLYIYSYFLNLSIYNDDIYIYNMNIYHRLRYKNLEKYYIVSLHLGPRKIIFIF